MQAVERIGQLTIHFCPGRVSPGVRLLLSDLIRCLVPPLAPSPPSASCISDLSWPPTGPAPHTRRRWAFSPPQLLVSTVDWTSSSTNPCPPARAPSPPWWWCLDVALCHQPSSRLEWPLAASTRPPSPWPGWEQGTRRPRPNGSPPPSSCSP